ncbi:C40 family peptidase [Corynebacterium lowii]|uniref:Putative endopeptidase n=1 Tax=Corynebacterium lowii TaxID=1544413 RepID=A0A0Q0YWN0_9CORY|nr:NlpC/P60 family protein [Corynebacterium lowii]KQB86783.1 putative endopeptidase precursor [Corynebacterium lowii]MDP9851469.1 cell wall-associated NlpC family hydrolase [Corynebacterium lowii]
MTKHRRQDNATARRFAAASALAVGATAVAPVAANAATLTVPNTDFSVEVPGLENLPGYEYVQDQNAQAPAEFTPAAVSELSSPAAPAEGAEEASFLPQAPSSSNGQSIVDVARAKIGSPYVYGAAGPNAFDCSGFTSWVYSQVGKSIPRTSQAQASSGTPVAYGDLQPGDIVAFYGGASHVGIYVGNGMIIDALNSGSPVAERPLDMMPFHSAVRF